MTGKEFAQFFIDAIHSVEQRCMAADGPVTPTHQEITDDELRKLYQAAQTVVAAPENLADPLEIVRTIELGLARGYTPAELLDENSPLRDRMREATRTAA